VLILNLYRVKLLGISFFILLSACVVNNSQNPPTPEEIDDFLIKAYKREFNLNITHPAFVYPSQNKRYTSTAYYENELYRIYVNDEGKTSSQISTPFLPKGDITVLTIFVNYANLNLEDIKDTLWPEAQASINRDHEEWADQLGLEAPIVKFENINLLIDEGRITEPSTSNLRAVASENKYSSNDYDIIAFIDLNQNEPSGGFAVRKNNWVKMGWFYNIDEDKVLTAEKLRGIAYGVYHHEIGHLFGWDHEWSDAKEGDLFITHPKLFGWEDINNNGIIEIFDDSPYGIR